MSSKDNVPHINSSAKERTVLSNDSGTDLSSTKNYSIVTDFLK
jgi:hypothetical protein